jgi:hypothetical protein
LLHWHLKVSESPQTLSMISPFLFKYAPHPAGKALTWQVLSISWTNSSPCGPQPVGFTLWTDHTDHHILLFCCKAHPLSPSLYLSGQVQSLRSSGWCGIIWVLHCCLFDLSTDRCHMTGHPILFRKRNPFFSNRVSRSWLEYNCQEQHYLWAWIAWTNTVSELDLIDLREQLIQPQLGIWSSGVFAGHSLKWYPDHKENSQYTWKDSSHAKCTHWSQWD